MGHPATPIRFNGPVHRRSGVAGAVLVALAVGLWFALAGTSSPGTVPPPVRTSSASLVSARLLTPRARPASLPALSIQELAGQRVVYAYTGLRPPSSLLAAIRAGQAAGVILFAGNISSSSQIRGVAAQLQRAAMASPVHARLLILTDQEGGQVRRLPGAPLLSEKQVGEQPNATGAAAAAGTGAGRNLGAAGVNVNLAPVLDVYRTPGNFIDEFQRSYSSRPATVGRLGAAFISAQQRLGVSATAKHFPGLGAATRSENTDLEPVVLNNSLADLRAVDEAPYRAAIAAGVKLVMTSWAVYPALDRHRPAGLSPTILQQELRGRLGFRGVTITDAIGAGALRSVGGVGKRAVLAAAAGADLILCANSGEGQTVVGALATALRHNQLSRSAAVQAATRVLSLRGR